MQPMQNNDILFVAFIKNVIFDICIPAAYQKNRTKTELNIF